jgi:hypothetical protein
VIDGRQVSEGKDKAKKQHAGDKTQKQAAAMQKAKPASLAPAKKGK